MPRFAVTVIVVLLVIVGALFFLAGRDAERPQTHVEKAVALANLT